MDLSAYLDVLRRRWKIVAAVAMMTLAAVSGFTLLTTPVYTSTARLFFAVEGSNSVSDLAQGTTFAQRQMTSFAEVASSPLVLAPVIDELDLETTPEQLARSVTVQVPTDTVILEISAHSEDANEAASVANAIAAELTSTAADLAAGSEGGPAPVLATVITPAEVAGAPSAPNVPRNLGLGLVLGVLLGLGVALLRHVLDTKVRGEQDVIAVTGTPMLAAVGVEHDPEDARVFVHDDPHGAPAEAVRRLRTNLQFVNLDGRSSSTVVTSSVPGEGKSTTAINLAAAFADTGARVVLVDADLRRPSIGEYLGLEGRVGLTTVLIGRAEIDDVVQPWRDSSLDILTAGAVPPNPSELLGSKAMAALLETLTAKYDAVIIDSPPLLPVTDAAILAKMTGGTLVVAGADRVHKNELQTALDALESVDAHVLGIVLNKVEAKRRDGYSYGYGSYAPIDSASASRSRSEKSTTSARRSTRHPTAAATK